MKARGRWQAGLHKQGLPYPVAGIRASAGPPEGKATTKPSPAFGWRSFYSRRGLTNSSGNRAVRRAFTVVKGLNAPWLYYGRIETLAVSKSTPIERSPARWPPAAFLLARAGPVGTRASWAMIPGTALRSAYRAFRSGENPSTVNITQFSSRRTLLC